MLKKIKNVILLFVTAALLVSCSGTLVNFKYENSQMINKKLGLAYNAAPLNYQPVSVGEAYGYYKKIDLTLYEINGLDPKEWLTEEYIGASTTIFYSDKITLPRLSELGANKIFVCVEDELTYSLSTIDNIDIINSLIELYENGEYEEWPLINSIQLYELKFYSEDKYPHLYFNLTYGEFPEGKFIYDRSTKRSVNIGNLLDDYIG